MPKTPTFPEGPALGPAAHAHHHRAVFKRLLAAAFLLLTLLALPGAGSQGSLTVFGPRTYTRGTGEPVTVADRFTVSSPGSGYLLRVETDGVASASVSINGASILAPADFNNPNPPRLRPPTTDPPDPGRDPRNRPEPIPSREPDVLERPLALLASNEIAVELHGEPGGRLVISIVGDANRPPAVTIAPVEPVRAEMSATLVATVSDDGVTLETPALSWSQIWGPAPVSFGTPNAATTAVSFTARGGYILRLSAFDGAHTTTADVTVMVFGGGGGGGGNTPINHPPAANAGGPYSGLAGQPITFIGWGSDPDGNTLTFAWRFSDGGTATGSTATHTFAAAGSYTATLTVNDGRGGTASATAAVSVSEQSVNRPPTASAGGPYAGTAGQAVQFSATGSDPDNDALTFAWTFGDGGTATGASPAHTYSVAGTYTATLTVSDGRGGSVTALAAVTIARPNHAPTANAGGPYSGTAAQPVTFSATGSDEDGDPLVFVWSFSDGAVATGQSVTHTFAAAGNYTALLTVSDNHAATATATAAVTISAIVPGNLAPTARAGGPYSGTAGYAVNFTGSGSDPDSDPLTFTWAFSDGGTASGATASHTFPAAGSFTATLTVSDGRGGSATSVAVVNITSVQPGNQPPSASAGGPYSAQLGEAVTFTGSATDPDNDPLAYDWAFSDGGTATGGSVVHAFGAAGTFTAVLTVSDGRGGTATATALVTVSGTPTANRAPSASAGGPYVVTAGAALALAATGVDPDGDPLTFSWSFSDGGAATGSSVTHTFTSAGSYTATVTVGDGRGGAATATAPVTVEAPTPGNQPPTAQAGGPYTGTTGQPLSFSGSGTDPDGDILSFSWGFSDGATASGAVTTRTFGAAGSFTATLTVTDGRGGTASSVAIVTITAPENHPPTAGAGGPYSGGVGQLISFTGMGSDPDNDPLAYAWDFGDGGTAAGATATHAFAAAGTYTATLTVSDGRGGSASATASVTIAAAPPNNDAPTARLSAPASGTVGEALAFDGSASSDPDGDTLAFAWSFGDGATAAGATATHAFAAAGTFSITLTVNDGNGHASSATASIRVDPPPNRPPTADAGGPYTGEAGIPVAFTGAASRDPDGDALTYSWDFGDGSSGSGQAPTHAYANAGSFTVTLTVADAHGTSASATAPVAIAAAADRTPPAVSLTAPREALPGSQVTLAAAASDNVGVQSVVIRVEGEDFPFAAPPYQRVHTLPAVASPGAVVQVVATATDAAGNSSSASAAITIASQPDTEPPTVSMNAPHEAAAGTTLTITASAHDNTGVSAVALLVDGSLVTTLAAPPYQFSWPVPPTAQPGTIYTLTARASDYSGHTTDATAPLTVSAVPDTIAPTVTLSVPPLVTSGASVELTATAADNVGVAAVTFTVEGAHISTLVAPPYRASYVVPAGLPSGAVLHVEARAVDGASLSATDARTATVAASPAPGQGILFGSVYDDSTGLPVAGATVRAAGTSLSGLAYTQAATTDARGRYVITAPEGQASLRVSGAGTTRVDRPVTFTADGNAYRAHDARLTVLAPGTPVSAIVGGTIGQDGIRLTLAGGALAADTTIALTSIGGQGLQGLLPAGWSPVAAVDIAPPGLAFAQPARLVIPNAAGLPADTSLLLAEWDANASAWRAVSAVSVGGDGTSMEAEVPGSGQYAWLAADVLPSAPSQPVAGSLVPGVAASSIPLEAATTVSPDPKVLFYSPGVRSLVTGSIGSGGVLSSGTPVRLVLAETYRFADGSEAQPETLEQDLVFYQQPGATGFVRAVFPVTPSLQFEAISLERGVIGVELQAPGPSTAVKVVSSSGGQVEADGGVRFDAPPGAFTQPTPVVLWGADISQLRLTLPADLEFLGGAWLSFSGELALPGVLSIPRPAAAVSADRILLLRAVEIEGQTRLVLAARARFDGDRIVSETSLPGAADVLDGARVAGRYLFVQAAAPLGFTSGSVLGVDGQPLAGALVTQDRLAVASISSASGRYASAMPGGPAVHVALDLLKNDKGTATAAVVAGLTAALDIRLVAQPPAVVSITPADGTVNVPLSTPVVIRFSEPLDPGTVNVGGISLAGGTGTVAGTLALSSNDTVVTFRPAEPLAPNTVYTISIAGTVADAAGYPMGTAVTSRFTSLDTAAPPLPEAGSLSATIPSGGTTTVSATQGTAGLHDTVTILNLTKGTATPALVQPDGGFSAIVNAGLTDELRVEITDAAGNRTSVEVPRYQDPDGSVVIGPEGGQVTAEGDLVLDIAAGTFPDGAIVRFTALTPEEFDSPVKAEWGYPMVGAFELSASVQPQHYMNVSMPVPAGTDPTTPGIVAELVTVLGNTRAMSVVDTAKIVDGRLVTSSPPCPGLVSKYGRYAAYLDNDPARETAFGMALLSLAPSVRQDVFVQGMMLRAPFMPVPIPLYPSMTVTTSTNPSTPFIALLNATGDVAGTLAAADASGTAGACYPVPADTPMQVVLRDAVTGSVISSASVTTPPAGSSAPVTLFYDPSDKTAPSLGYASWNPITGEADVSKPIVLRFSEPITFSDVPGILPVTFIDIESGLAVPVRVKVEQNNRQLTLEPIGALAQGHTFTIYAPGLRDLAGNSFGGTLTFKTFAPKVVAPAGVYRLDRDRTKIHLGSSLWTARDSAGQPILTDLAFSDIDHLTLSADESTDGKWHTWLFLVGGNTANTGSALMTVDASKPSEPAAVTLLPGYGHYYTAIRVYRDFALEPRVTAAPGADIAAWNARTLYYDTDAPADRICDTGNRDVSKWQARKLAAGRSVSTHNGCGDMALVVDYSIYYSRILGYDVTDPTHPQLITTRLLSDNGPQFGLPRQNHAPAGLGLAMGFDVAFGADVTHTWPPNGGTTETHGNTNAAYVAMDQLGLGLVDVDRNTPGVERYERDATPPVIESEGFYSLPYYQDVKVIGGKVVAIANDRLGASGLSVLDVFEPSLATPTAAPLSLNMKPRYMAKAEGLLYDFDGNGENERHNLAFVTGNAGVLAGVDIDSAGTPTLVNAVPLPLTPPVDNGFKVVTRLGSCPELNLMTSANGQALFVSTNASTTYHAGTCADVAPDSRLMVFGSEKAPSLTKPTARLANLGSGGVNHGSHRYLVVFDTPVGKFRGSLPSDPVVIEDVNANGQVKLTDLPTSLFATAREIYRTSRDLNEPFRFLARIDNVSTEYIDNTDDRLLGDIAPKDAAPTILATNVTVLDLLPKVSIKSLGKLTIDTESRVAYVAASWLEDTTEYQGILAFDLRTLQVGRVDANKDGWDDRLLSKTKIIGPNAPVTNGTLTGVRYDPARKLVYATYRSNQDADQTYVAIVKTCDCAEAKADLLEGNVGTGFSRSFPATDSEAVVFITEDVVDEGKVRARFEVTAPSGTTVSYQVTELPVSGNPDDALVDLAYGKNRGTIDPSDPRVTFYLNSTSLASMAGPSLLVVDLTDDQGNFIKRTVLVLVPGGVPVSPAVVRTVVDKTNKKSIAYTDYLSFVLPYEAKVTITVNGSVLQAEHGGALTPMKDVLMPAGVNRVEITPQMIPFPGEHPFVITAAFRDPDSKTVVAGALEHSVTLTESLPIGASFDKGVSLYDGHLTISRTDVAIPAVGPPLQFARTYSSADSRSSGPMGAGWTHNYEAKLTVDSTGDVTVGAGDGGGGRFTQAGAAPGGGTLFKPQAGYHGSLVYVNGGYDYYSKVRYRYHYDASVDSIGRNEYRLAYIEDPSGNRQTVSYSGNLVSQITDSAGRTLGFSYEKKGVPAEDRVVRVDGPLGLVLEFTYDAYGNLVKAARGEASGATVTLLRDEQYEYTVADPRDRHNLLKVVDPNGHPTEYVYFQPGDPFPGEVATYTPGVSVLTIPMKSELVKQVKEGTGAELAVTSYAFDYSDHATKVVTTVTDPRNVVTTYTMNPRGTVSEKRVAAGSGDVVTKMKWAFEDGIDDVYVVEQTDALGRVTSFQYDSNGNVTRETLHKGTLALADVVDASGSPVSEVTTAYDYDPTFSIATKKTDAEGHVTLYGIDPATGRLLSQTTQPGGGVPDIVTRYDYADVTVGGTTFKGLLDKITDPLLHVTTYRAFDQWGNATEVVDAEGHVTTYTYDARGRVVEVVDGLGHHTRTEYDGLDRPTRITRFAGAQPGDHLMQTPDRVTTVKYLPGGQKSEVIDRPDHTATFAYDSRNRLVRESDEIVDADGVKSVVTRSRSYDANSNVASETDGRGSTRGFTYDALNRPRLVTLGARTLASYTYDAAGNKLSESDIHGHVTTLQHDWLYRVVRRTLPLAPYHEATAYDRVGNVLRLTDANGHSVTMTYDGVDRLLTRTNALQQVVEYQHDAAGNRTRETNRANGLVNAYTYDRINRPLITTRAFNDPLSGPVSYVTTVSYDDNAHTVTTTDAAGSVARVRVNGFDQVVEETVDPGGLGLVTTYQYDETGNLAALKDPEGSGPDAVHEYDGLGRKVRTETPLGGVERLYYDGNGNLVKEVTRAGVTLEHAYDELDRKSSDTVTVTVDGVPQEWVVFEAVYDDAANRFVATDANGKDTVHEYDALDREVAVTDPLGNTEKTEWDGVNKVATIDRRGARTEFTYDASNRLTGVSYVDASLAQQVVYDDANSRKSMTDARGIQTITQFDQLGRIRRVSRKHADLAAEYGAEEIVLQETRYDGANRVVDVVDAEGKVEHSTYDAAGRLVESVDGYGTPLAATTSFTHDGAGNVLTSTDPAGHTTRFEYDDRYRRVEEEDALGRVTQTAYDQAGNVIGVTEPGAGARQTTYAYDELNRLVRVDETRGGAGGVTTYAYDRNGNKTGRTDANGQQASWLFDAGNRLTDSYEAGGVHWHYEYDANGNQTRIVDPKGQVVVKAWDAINRLASKEYSNHAAGPDGTPVYPNLLRVDYTYDGNSNETAVTERKRVDADTVRDETTAVEFDHLDREARRTNADGKALAQAYDKRGFRRRLTDADGVVTSYLYDALGRLASVTGEAGGGSSGVTSYAYWPDGLQRAISYPNGATSEFTYDAAKQLETLVNKSAGTVVSQYDYEYDLAGNRTSETQSHQQIDGGAAETIGYEYDALNRLTKATYAGRAISYTYAPNGNRLTESGTDPVSGQPVNRTFGYNATNWLTTIDDASNPSAGAEVEYDANGNVARKKIGQLVDGRVAAPSTTVSYTYDVRDRLVGATTPDGRTSFDYDDTNQRTRLETPSYSLRFLSDEDSVVQEYEGNSGVTTAKYNYGNGLLSMVQVAGSTRSPLFFHADGLQSTSELTDASGGVQATYQYDAWGGVRAKRGTSATRRQFTGHYFDQETGLSYFNARYYDATLGRFLSADTAAGDERNPVSLHRYLYAHANPLRYIDPSGHEAKPVVGLANPNDSTSTMVAKWLAGLAVGAVGSLGSGIAGLLESGVKGLADVGMAGIGYLAIEATRGQYVDEIGALLTPVSGIGKAAAEKGTVKAIREAATGFVKDTVVGVVTLPARVIEASKSGDPEALGSVLVETVQMLEPAAKPGLKAVEMANKRVLQGEIAREIMMRERISKRGVDGATREVRGTISKRDAMTLASVCLEAGTSGCGFIGGFSEANKANLAKNRQAKTTLGRGELVLDVDDVTGRRVPIKYQGDIDFLVYKPDQKSYANAELAHRLNQQMSVNLFDTMESHGVMGEFLPDGMVTPKHKAMWWKQQGLPEGSNIKAADYWKKGVYEPGVGRYAPFIKPTSGHMVPRKIDPNIFEFKNPFMKPREVGPMLPTVVQAIVGEGLDRHYERLRQQEKEREK